MKLAAYAISKNEQANVERFCDQVAHFDHVTVLDTGSTDQTVALLKQRGVHVHAHTFDPFDFSQARNMCMNLVPDHMDWLMVLDFNDHFDHVHELRHILSHTQAHAATVNYLSSESDTYVEHKIRLHRPHTHAWVKSVHEYLVPSHSHMICVHVPWNVTKHVSEKARKHAFYTEICEWAHVKYPEDPHYSWWALSYYRNVQNWQKVRYFCEHYLSHTQAYTLEFRIYAWIYLSECVQSENWHTCVDMAIHAFSESLKFREIAPDCVARAAERLKQLGICIVDSRMFT